MRRKSDNYKDGMKREWWRKPLSTLLYFMEVDRGGDTEGMTQDAILQRGAESSRQYSQLIITFYKHENRAGGASWEPSPFSSFPFPEAQRCVWKRKRLASEYSQFTGQAKLHSRESKSNYCWRNSQREVIQASTTDHAAALLHPHF